MPVARCRFTDQDPFKSNPSPNNLAPGTGRPEPDTGTRCPEPEGLGSRVELAVHLPQVLPIDVRVDLRRRDVGMP
jgi:hypothetical protein